MFGIEIIPTLELLRAVRLTGVALEHVCTMSCYVQREGKMVRLTATGTQSEVADLLYERLSPGEPAWWIMLVPGEPVGWMA